MQTVSPQVAPAQAKIAPPYQIVTDRLLAVMERGEIPWRRAWSQAGGPPQNLVSKKPYRGINIFMTAITSWLKGYESPFWLTYQQAKDRGGFVKKGEERTPLIFYKHDEKENEETGEVDERWIIRYYRVFNVQQCEGVKYDRPELKTFEFDPVIQAERIIAAMPNPPAFDVGRPSYLISADTVRMPAPERFETPAEYYSTKFHELTHSTGHAKRLGRFNADDEDDTGKMKRGKEELIAEMGAAFLCASAGIEQSTMIENQAAYLQSWMQVIKAQPKILVSAAGAAQKAADYILNVEGVQS